MPSPLQALMIFHRQLWNNLDGKYSRLLKSMEQMLDEPGESVHLKDLRFSMVFYGICNKVASIENIITNDKV